jgi:predicted nuclease of predicted toxin-antitoxin system
VKLLLDENLSPRLVRLLARTYAQVDHIDTLGLRGRSDQEVWERAAADGYVLVSKDDDFRQLSFLHGAPPKVVWLAVGDASTDTIAALLTAAMDGLQTFVEDPEESLLIFARADTSR